MIKYQSKPKTSIDTVLWEINNKVILTEVLKTETFALTEIKKVLPVQVRDVNGVQINNLDIFKT